MPPQKRPLSETDTNTCATGPENKKAKGLDTSTSPHPRVNYDALSMPELKAELKERELHISGPRTTLIYRLQRSDHDRSLPVKQAIEAAARKRRETAAKSKQVSGTFSHEDFKRRDAREHEVLRKGPNGRAIYDDYGYKLDYEKIKKSVGRTGRYRPNFAKMDKWLQKMAREKKLKAKIIGDDEKSVNGTSMWDDRVAQDLEIPIHKVEICDYEEWQRRGFQFDPDTVTKEDRDRVIDMTTGSAFRA